MAVTGMSSLSIWLFGKFYAQRDGRDLGGLDTGRAQELFSYLLLFRDRPHLREIVAEILWSDSSILESRKCLRQALWRLRGVLDEGSADGEHVLVVDAEWLSIDPTCPLHVDVEKFERAYEAAGRGPGRNLDRESARMLQTAVVLYTGDLLEGCYQDWCVYERERLQNMYLTMLDKLIGYCEAAGEYEMGVDYGAKILRIDHARERTHQWLMRLRYLAGDRTGAIRQYQRCATALREELDVEPAQSTTALYEQICADCLDGALHGAMPATVPIAATHSVPGIIDRLSNIRQELADVEQSLRLEA